MFYRCEGAGGGGVKEIHEAPGRPGQPPLYCYWEGERDGADCHRHESGDPPQSQTHCQGLKLFLFFKHYNLSSWHQPVNLTCFLLCLTLYVRCRAGTE